MIQTLFNKKARKKISWMMITIMIMEMVCPTISSALSSGPVQPEVQGFEPVGTTDMVDLFTGDFVYNIPLMDVEGYPVNISYHGGVTMEQEASWVGLGWNITPGSVNHAIRGLPDEFAGDTIEKEVNLKTEINKKIGLAGMAELFGAGEDMINVGVTLGGYVNISNYRGVSVDFTGSAGINTQFKMVSAGLNIGASIGSQAGASINYGLSAGVGISQQMSHDLNGSFNLSTSGVYSPRTGLRRDKGFDAKLSVLQNNGISTGTSVPIGLQNYTAAITNPSYMNSYTGQLKLGGEIFGIYPDIKVNGSVTNIRFDQNGSRKGYGYLNLDKGGDSDLLDFSREKDGMFNATMQLLPQSHLTYDIYSVSGQGTGGSFRPFRNDVGSVFDPVTHSSQHSDAYGAEAGLGNLFSAGLDYSTTNTDLQSGPWSKFNRPFRGKNANDDYYEDVYFKEAGELTENNETYLNSFGNTQVVTPEDVGNIPLQKPNAAKRIVRANHIYTHTGANADTAALVDSKQLVSYTDSTGFKNYPNVSKTYIPRVDAGSHNKLKRTTSQLTEIVQNQKDGRRYVYGLPVLNNVEKEVSFAVDTLSDTLDRAKFSVKYAVDTEDSKNNNKGLDHYYSSTVTPTYVTAHLLTSVLSADYVDVTGNGISDDDLGSYTKFNYTRKSKDYRWRVPIDSARAQYSPGYYSDRRDDKASYTIGSREQWMLHSIETKNYVAEFYVSPRKDAMGVLDKILTGSVYNEAPYNAPGSLNDNKSYKLDSIVLYNKHDRFINGAKAQPIKAVYFTYDYSLCVGVPNAVDTTTGKLTLRKIQIKYGSSNLNMSAAYAFKYDYLNPSYNNAAKDRWGFYKPNTNAKFNNFEFPFTEQSTNTDNYAKAWSLSEVDLPSGGIIKVDYESDDYAYVQDKEAMEMFKITGMGNSPVYDNSSDLYFNPSQPNLYFYFDRRKTAENNLLSFRDNYMKGTNYLYYNVPVELKDGLYEPVKGYAEVADIGKCADSIHGYVKLVARKLDGTNFNVNPVAFTALNLGRYSLPQILYPGNDPESSDIDNVVAGLYNSIKELFSIAKNPLQTLIQSGKAQSTDISRAFMRLTSPGLAKKGGGQRVKSIRFYDNWSQMAGGNEATYGKTYDYTIDREDGKGTISSGVASYEPSIGGDELPQRIPVNFTAQAGTNFPPNDPVELYQELPIGESFFPSPVVGYSNVRARSINVDIGRSSQTEDINGFYTAKDFPIQTMFSGINTPDAQTHFSLKDVTVTQSSTQGFSIILNDMHGKPRNTEHWVLKPAGGAGAKELVNYQKYEYLTQNGVLSNMVPAFNYNAGAGHLEVVNKKMGIETDLTIDSRMRKEETKMTDLSGNLNGFLVWIIPIVLPLVYPFDYSNIVTFNCASVTKVTQQYGVVSKVINNNQGAITEVRNEVFDPQTGNALVSSVNNQFGDREYTVSYPAYWAYKELGLAYENHDLRGKFANPLKIDTFGAYAKRFVNFNPGYSSHYDLPSNILVGRVIIDEEMPKFKIGDELLVQKDTLTSPVKTWVMGYTSDTSHCYLILDTREPYKQDNFWQLGNAYNNALYRITRSGNRNRLGETIQSYTTTDSTNIFPYLKNDLINLITLNATRYNHNLDQVFAANKNSDSLNPFTTGKVDQYKPEQQIINLKKRNYVGGTTRNAGTFATPAYWKTETDNYPAYCPDSFIVEGAFRHDTIIWVPPVTIQHNDSAFNNLSFTYLGGDSVRVNYATNGFVGSSQVFSFLGFMGSLSLAPAQYQYLVPGYSYPGPWMNMTGYNPYQRQINSISPGSFVIHDSMLVSTSNFYSNFPEYINYSDGANSAAFTISYNRINNQFTIGRPGYVFTGTSTPAVFTNAYVYNPATIQFGSATSYPGHYDTIHVVQGQPQPYRVRKKILLGKVGHYDFTDFENWIKTQQVTKYNWNGQEIENKEEGIGYNSAVYGYNQQMPVCVAKNAQHGQVLFEGFEDYALLQPQPDKNASYMPLVYSPFYQFLQSTTPLGLFYKLTNLTATNNAFNISVEDAHTGNYSMKVANADIQVPLNGTDPGMASGYSFKMGSGGKYVATMWLKPIVTSNNVVVPTNSGSASILMDTVVSGSTGAAVTNSFAPSSNIIEGWQQYTVTFDVPAAYKNFTLKLAKGFFYDDIRIYPFESNSKAFVYHPVTRKLTATLDENNYATFYEYDAEGNLVRTKKETEKGILTISESRSTHHKAN